MSGRKCVRSFLPSCRNQNHHQREPLTNLIHALEPKSQSVYTGIKFSTERWIRRLASPCRILETFYKSAQRRWRISTHGLQPDFGFWLSQSKFHLFKERESMSFVALGTPRGKRKRRMSDGTMRNLSVMWFNSLWVCFAKTKTENGN